MICKHCNKQIFNEYSHIKKNHKNLLLDFLKNKNIDIRFCNVTNNLVLPKYKNKNPYIFFTDRKTRKKINKKVFIPDFFIKDENLVVEFFGDYWHANPKFNSHNDIILNTCASNIWESDYERINFLKKQYDVDTILIWENDFRKNPEKTINNLINEIYDRKNKITKKL